MTSLLAKAGNTASAHRALGSDLHALDGHCVGLRCKSQVRLFGRHARGLGSLKDYQTLRCDSDLAVIQNIGSGSLRMQEGNKSNYDGVSR